MKCRSQVCCTWSLLLAVDIQKHTCHLMRQGAIQHLPHNLHNSGWWRMLFLVDDQWWKSNYAARSSHHSMELESIDIWKTSFLCQRRRSRKIVREPQNHLCKEQLEPATKEIIKIEPARTSSINWTTCVPNYLHLIASFGVTASNILSKGIFSNDSKHRKPISKFHCTESLKRRLLLPIWACDLWISFSQTLIRNCCTKIIYTLLQTLCYCFKYLIKRNLS